MDMLRVTARWTGFNGAPGYSNFFFAGGGGLISDAQQVAQRVADAFEAIENYLPSVVTIGIENDVAVVDSDTGEVQDFQSINAIGSVQGNANTTYAGPAGAVVNWRTNDLRNGRRIRGRTFLVPMSDSIYGPDGTLADGVIGSLNAFGNTMVGGDLDSEFGVWSRPVGGSGGVFATATSFNVPDMVAVLRSRRD